MNQFIVMDRILAEARGEYITQTPSAQGDQGYYESEIETRWCGLPVLVTFQCYETANEIASIYVLDKDWQPMHKLDLHYVTNEQVEQWEQMI